MKDVMTLILFIVLMVVVAVGLSSCQAMIDKSNWNNGKCGCGGEYKFSNADHVKNGGDYYYYHCTNCGDVIETHSPQKIK
jgi:hypothetical protein